jgi:NAD(P)-dependent dehydrogenase (short-subunit alcohol dehydrogenase family)
LLAPALSPLAGTTESTQPNHLFQKHGKIIPLRGDVTSHESLEEVVSAIQSQSGHINLLVNNAGVAGNVYKDRPETFASAEEFKNYFLSKETQQDFTKVFDVNVSSVWFTTLHFLPLLEAGNNTEWGRKGITSQVVTISSVAAFRRQDW